MDTQFGLAHLWAQGDGITRTVALLLLGMSVASWWVMLVKALDLRTRRAQAKDAEGFWHASDFEAGLSQLDTEAQNPFRQLAETGREATRHVLHPGQHTSEGTNEHTDHHPNRTAPATPRPQLHDQLDLSDWVTRELQSQLDESTARLQSGLAVLASVGSTAPFVGLFGTVWGIYHALLGIASAGQSTIDQVAGPIGEALIMTALGLAVAIPAVLGYNALVRGNKGVRHQLNRFAHDLHALFVTGARVRQGGQAAGPATSPAALAPSAPSQP
jgi:biopolymer transport protein ExbB